MKEQVEKYLSGNEAAALAVKQIGYDIMGYYPITPSTQIAENLDLMGAKGEVDITMIPAEGEHSAAGICYGASAAGARAFNATSANGLLYALEQFPVQSGTRYPMVMNVACRTVSGPLSIKGDHSDIMFMLNTGWIILFAHSVQQVYDFNIIATKLGESVSLPVVVAYDGFFTSHQKKRSYSFKSDEDVKNFVGKKKEKHDLLDLENPITIGSYMNEPDLINNRFQLYEAVTLAGKRLDEIFKSYENLSQRHYEMVEEYKVKDAEIVMILLGSAFDTVTVAVDKLRKEGIKAGVITLNVIRPFPIDEVVKRVKDKCKILVADRQDSYGANGGNLSLEVRAAFQRKKKNVEIKSVVYGLGGIDFDVSDGRWLLEQYDNLPDFSYYGVTKGGKEKVQDNLLKKIDKERTMLGITEVKNTGEGLMVKGGQINATTAMPDRIASGHGACPGCGILVNLNLLLRAIEDPVVLLFQTGCGMIITTAYPKTSFRVPYIHNLFQNGAATMSGIVEACKRRQEKGEIPKGDIVFIMVTGDGGMDIGMGSALGTALRGHNMIIFEYDNGGYMNTGYQLSYSTPKGAKKCHIPCGFPSIRKDIF